jgi:mono/diheme cytochrome c family protein
MEAMRWRVFQRQTSRLLALALVLPMHRAGAAEATVAPPDPQGLALFTHHVRPTLTQHCLECHGGRHTKSGFDLSTRDGLLQGGEHGPALVLTNADASRLLRRIHHTEEPGMPFKREKLPAEAISNLTAWVLAGAPYDAPLTWADPESKIAARDVKNFWAVQPLTRPAIPKVAATWVRTPIDAFILAKLTEQGLTPSPEADRRTLIRRLTFDLHGLPPTPAEVDAFVNDPDPNAYEKLVDRLLASPRYGERWGRHWLDVVHYGDTHGYDKDKRRAQAWPYRDYVIRSLNADKPYGRFAQEQIAGDALFPEEPDGIVATGFIAAGPWDYVGHMELREDTTDKKITRVLDRDDMVANTIGTFCSLTIHCARCHDHKFDPITMEDYYRLQAVFAGIDRANRPYDKDRAVHNRRRTLLPEQKNLEKELADLNAAVAKIVTPRLKGLEAWVGYLRGQLGESAQPHGALPSPSKGYHSQIARTRYETKWVQVDLGRSWPLAALFLVPAHVKHENHPGPGFGFPKRFKVEVSDDPEFKQAHVVADETKADFPNPGDAPYAVELAGQSARFIRVTATRLWKRGEKKFEDWIFALGELVAVSGGRNVALGAYVTSLDAVDASSSWARRFLTDGCSSLVVLANPSPTDGYQSAVVGKADTNAVKWVQADLGRPLPIDQVRLVPARSAELPDKSGYGFPVRFKIEASNDPEFVVADLIEDRTGGDFQNPGDKPFAVAGQGVTARFVRVTATKLWADKDEHVFALAELQVTAGDENVARRAQFVASDSVERGRWSAASLGDGFSSVTALADPSPLNGFHSLTNAAPETNKWVQVDLGRALPIEQVQLVPARWDEQPDKPGYGFPVRFKVEVSDDAAFTKPTLVADERGSDFPNPGDEPYVVVVGARKARFVRVTATKLFKQKDDAFVFALAELKVLSRGTNAARGAAVSASDASDKGRWAAKGLVDGYGSLAPLEEWSPSFGYRSGAASRRTSKWVQFDLGQPAPLDKVRVFPVNLPGQAGYGFPARLRVETSEEAEFTRPQLLGEFAGRARVVEFDAQWRPARFVRVTAPRLWKGRSEARFALAEVQIISEGRNLAPSAKVTALDSAEDERWSTRFLADGHDSQRRLDNTAEVVAALRDLRQQQETIAGHLARRRELVEPLIDEATKVKLAKTTQRLAELDAQIAALPKPDQVFGVANDFVKEQSFSPPEDPRPVHLLKRGDVSRPGDEMKPGALACVPGLNAEFELANPKHEAERRAALARWITDPKNPLTWRSIVNRVWHYHFGRGLVETPNDFGRMGAAPTHPELLDWLAAEFLAHGQSLKWLHRQIVVSAVYRQSSAHNEAAALADAGNQYLWRMNRQRLEAESVRDAVLAVSGRLDFTMGGPGFDLFEFQEDHSPRYLYEKHQRDDAKSCRRSVYRFVVRSVPDPWMETLDCADPSQNVPVRNTTITALQALALLNNPFMVRQAEHFAEHVKKLAAGPAQQIAAAYRLALGRAPTDEELARLADYHARHGLANTCRLLLNSNEFIFVD